METTNQEKICPFCAETIKAAAIVCRYCNSDLDDETLQKRGFVSTPPKGDEVVYLQTEDINITSARAIINDKTYAMSNITSVSLHVVHPDTSGATAIGLIGVFGGGVIFLVCLQFNETLYALLAVALAVLFVGLSIWFARIKKTEYAVRLGSASGESDALFSKDKTYVQNIVTAVNQAIVKRG